MTHVRFLKESTGTSSISSNGLTLMGHKFSFMCLSWRHKGPVISCRTKSLGNTATCVLYISRHYFTGHLLYTSFCRCTGSDALWDSGHSPTLFNSLLFTSWDGKQELLVLQSLIPSKAIGTLRPERE